jgi:hypothetical protein
MRQAPLILRVARFTPSSAVFPQHAFKVISPLSTLSPPSYMPSSQLDTPTPSMASFIPSSQLDTSFSAPKGLFHAALAAAVILAISGTPPIRARCAPSDEEDEGYSSELSFTSASSAEEEIETSTMPVTGSYYHDAAGLAAAIKSASRPTSDFVKKKGSNNAGGTFFCSGKGEHCTFKLSYNKVTRPTDPNLGMLKVTSVVPGHGRCAYGRAQVDLDAISRIPKVRSLILGFGKTQISTRNISAAAGEDLTSQHASEIKNKVLKSHKKQEDLTYRLLPAVAALLVLGNEDQIAIQMGFKWGEPQGKVLHDNEVKKRLVVAFGGQGTTGDTVDFKSLKPGDLDGAYFDFIDVVTRFGALAGELVSVLCNDACEKCAPRDGTCLTTDTKAVGHFIPLNYRFCRAENGENWLKFLEFIHKNSNTFRAGLKAV